MYTMTAPQNTNTLHELVRRAREGDLAAEQTVLDHLRVRFVFLAKRRTGSRDAEDLAQEACLTVAQKYRSLASDVGFEPWAYSVLRNKIGNLLQQRERDRRYFGETPGDIDGAMDTTDAVPDLKRQLLICLRRIGRVLPQYVRVLNLMYQGYGTEEICERLQVKPNHLYVLLHRARKALKDCMENGASSK
jgi:RNA polymerase sigma-70 factor, ECF subfamily